MVAVAGPVRAASGPRPGHVIAHSFLLLPAQRLLELVPTYMHQRFNTVAIDAVAKFAEVADSEAFCMMLTRQVGQITGRAGMLMPRIWQKGG